MSQELVTADRIRSGVEALGYACGVTETGVVEGMWDGVAIALTNTRDWLHISTVWNPEQLLDIYDDLPSTTQRELVTAACEQWNSAHIHPRAYASEDGERWVISLDVVIGCRAGFNDEQLQSAIAYALTACVEGSAEVGSLLPPVM